MYALIDISNQMLEASVFDMEGEIRGEAHKRQPRRVEDADLLGVVVGGSRMQTCSA